MNRKIAKTKDILSKVAIVLVRPRVAENVGSAARICYNMGIENLILVRDSLPEREPMAKLATHNAAHIIDSLQCFPTLEQAIADYNIVIGTTARRGRHRFVHQDPRETVEKLLPLLPLNKAAIIFGPEDTGLSNDELKLCQMASAIPTDDFSSLNLAQAVAIHCYELYQGVVHQHKDMAPAPQLATSFELESMYSFLEESLMKISFMEESGRSHWMANVRNFFSRRQLTSKDANIVRGICKKFLQYQQSDTK